MSSYSIRVESSKYVRSSLDCRPYIHTYIHTYIYTVQTYIHTYIHRNLRLNHLQVSKLVLHTYISCIHTVHTYILCLLTHSTYIHTYIHTVHTLDIESFSGKPTRIHTYIHTYIHTVYPQRSW